MHNPLQSAICQIYYAVNKLLNFLSHEQRWAFKRTSGVTYKELGTRQHCRNNVAMFSLFSCRTWLFVGQSIAGSCLFVNFSFCTDQTRKFKNSKKTDEGPNSKAEFVLVSRSCLQVASNGQFWNFQEPTKPGFRPFSLKEKKRKIMFCMYGMMENLVSKWL